MPANLPPQYYDVEKKYREAKTPKEKLLYLQEMLAIIPKHKGTEKIQGDLKSKISKLKESMESGKKGGGATSAWYQVDKQGAGQVVLVGLPNAGKSAMLNVLTNTNVAVADYPFTTANPQIGMMKYEDILIQIIDTPPLSDETQAWLYSIYRSADLILIILDGQDNLETQYEIIKDKLHNRNIIYGCPGADNVKAMVIVNKADVKDNTPDIRIFREKLHGQLQVISVSAATGLNAELLKKEIFGHLMIIRVYTKKAGQTPVKKDPVVLKVGTTVIDAAEYIHKDFKNKLQYTRLWNDAGYCGQRIEKNHVLHDGDIIEFHV